jgi:DNA-binding CsgD family transcriptional regulator
MMEKSKRLRLSDVRAIFRLVGECRELGVDATLWRRHMLTELARLTGGQVGMGGLARTKDGLLLPVPATMLDVGWAGPREREVFGQFFKDQMFLQDPALQALRPLLSRFGKPTTQLTRSRRQLVDDRLWYKSAAYGDYHRPSGTDDGLMSFVQTHAGELHTITLHRPPGANSFSGREWRLLHVFHAELAAYLRTELAPVGTDPISSLSPRLRQVLVSLLEGDSEKQAAARLGLTRDSAHQYVKAVYRRFNVNTRAELMALFVRFPSRALLPA